MQLKDPFPDAADLTKGSTVIFAVQLVPGNVSLLKMLLVTEATIRHES
jgi:hypothetical protein